MRKTHSSTNRAVFAGVMGSVLVSGVEVLAQDAGIVLEEIIVTASRRAENLQDVALAVAVIDNDEYILSGRSTLAQELVFVPGVAVADAGRNWGNDTVIRGINSTGAAGVASYFDELPFGSSTPYADFGGSQLDGTLLDLSTIDVLKGPQGTLYGASAMGGLIKFNSRPVSLDEWSGSVLADVSSTEGGGTNQLYRVGANGPIATDTLGVSFTAFYRDKAGYIDNVSIPLDGWDDSEYYGGSGTLRWSVSEKLDIKLQGLILNSEAEGLATIQANSLDDVPVPGVAAGEPIFGDYSTGDFVVNPSEYEAELFGLTIDYDLGFADLLLATSIQEATLAQSSDVSFLTFLADMVVPENAPHTSVVATFDIGWEKVSQEIRLTSKSDQSFEWIVGAYYNDEEGNNSQDLVPTPAAPAGAFLVDQPSNYEELSLYATGTYAFSEQWDASLGIRFTDYSTDVAFETTSPLFQPLPKTENDEEETNYLFNVRYRPSDSTSFYGRIASGFRPGGANFVIVDPLTGQPLNNDFFEADSLVSYELGVKGHSASNRFSYELAAFSIDWEDFQVNQSINGIGVTANASEAQSMGAEVSVKFAVTEHLTVTGTYSYTKAELTADEPTLGGADGDQLPNSPENQGAIDVDYRFNIGEVPAFAGLAWQYKGDMPVGFDGYTDSSGMFIPPGAPRLNLDSYNLVDLRAGFTTASFDVSVYVTNVFDEYAYQNFFPDFFGGSAVPTRPRTYGGIVRWNF